MAAHDDSTLADGVWSTARRLRQAAREATAAWEVGPSHARALGAIGRLGPLRMRALSDELHIAPRSVTEVVDGLEDRGWVRRVGDPGDRRATLVELTAAGVRADRDIRAAREASAENVFAPLSANDRAQLARLLRKLGSVP